MAFRPRNAETEMGTDASAAAAGTCGVDAASVASAVGASAITRADSAFLSALRVRWS